jgi:uncharacterized protein YndB with AHSA1/START domain
MTTTPTPTPIAVTRTLTITAPIERVWNAITEPSKIVSWLGMSTVTLDRLEVGGKFTFDADGTGGDAVITVVEPPTRLAYYWNPEMGYEAQTLVIYVLESVPEGTHISVTESGFEALPADLRERISQRNGKGWTMSLEGIAAMVQDHDNDSK